MDADTNFFKVFGLPLCWQIDLKVLKENIDLFKRIFILTCLSIRLKLKSSSQKKHQSSMKVSEFFAHRCLGLNIFCLMGVINDENAISSDTSFLMKQLEYRDTKNIGV